MKAAPIQLSRELTLACFRVAVAAPQVEITHRGPGGDRYGSKASLLSLLCSLSLLPRSWRSREASLAGWKARRRGTENASPDRSRLKALLIQWNNPDSVTPNDRGTLVTEWNTSGCSIPWTSWLRGVPTSRTPTRRPRCYGWYSNRSAELATKSDTGLPQAARPPRQSRRGGTGPHCRHASTPGGPPSVDAPDSASLRVRSAALSAVRWVPDGSSLLG